MKKNNRISTQGNAVIQVATVSMVSRKGQARPGCKIRKPFAISDGKLSDWTNFMLTIS